MSLQRIVIWIGRAIIPLLIVYAAFHFARNLIASRKAPPKRPRPPAETRVDVHVLTLTNLPVTVSSQGTVDPRTESSLIPQVAGSIISVTPAFRNGGFFEANEELVTIDPSDYETSLIIAESELARARASLTQEVAQAEQARLNWERLGRDEAPSPLTLRKPQLAEARATVSAADARVKKAKRDLDRTHIRAPYPGRVLEQSVDLGQVVGPGTSLARIYAVDVVEIRLPLSKHQLRFVDLPEVVRHATQETAGHHSPKVVLRGNYAGKEHRWTGTVVRVEGAIDRASRQQFIVAQVDDPYAVNPPLKVGLYVEADIEGRRLENILAIPRAAVRAGSEILVVDATDKLQRVKVSPIWSDDKWIAVRPSDSLPPGSRLCTTPLPYAANGVNVLIGDALSKRPPPGKGNNPNRSRADKSGTSKVGHSRPPENAKLQLPTESSTPDQPTNSTDE